MRSVKLFVYSLLALITLVAVGWAVGPQVVQGQAAGTALATVQVAAQMDPAPTNCGPVPEAISLDSHFGPGLGSWPVWGTINEGGTEHKGILSMSKDHPTGETYLPGWWAQKVLWVVKLTYQGEVKLSGFNVADNSPIYFSLNNGQPQTNVASLNPDNPTAGAPGSDRWAYFPSLLWVSKAGCYVIQAQWNGGSWQQVIPVGYVEG